MVAYNLRYVYLAVFVCLNIIKAYFPDLIPEFGDIDLLPLWCGAGTYYVNQSTGNDANAGTSAAPWKNLYHAVAVTSASDIVNLTAPATAPYRGNINNTTASMTYQGNGAKAYILGSENVSHGATIGNVIENGTLDGWASATVCDKWSIALGTGTVGPEASIVNTAGGQSAKFVRTAGSHYFQSWFYLEASTEYALKLSHRETQADFRFKMSLIEKDPAPDNFLQADGTWSTTGYIYDNIGNSNGAWTQYSKTFTSNAAGWYLLEIVLGYSTTSYLDDISVTPTTNAYSWSVHSDDTYKLDQAKTLEIKTLLKCSATDWTANGVTSLVRPAMGSDKDALDPGEWIWVSGVLYYRLAAGETDIEAIHFEAGKLQERVNTVERAVQNTAAGLSLSNLWVGGANTNGYYMASTATDFALTECDAFGNGKDNVSDNFLLDGTGTITGGQSSYGGVKGYLVNGEAANVTLDKVYASYNYSGGVYDYGGGTMVVTRSISAFNGREGTANNAGFCAHSEAANNMTLYNSVAYGNYGRGVSVAGSGVVTVKNTVGYASVYDGGMGDAHIDATFSGTFTHTNNVFGHYYSADWTPDATEKTADPLFRSSTDFSLKAGSPAINAGTDVGLTTDFLGKPIRGLPDIGAYEFYGSTGNFGFNFGIGF